MSSGAPQTANEPENVPSEKAPARFQRWHKRVLSFCLITFALELGLFLAVYPWSSQWDLNFIPVRVPEFADVWMSSFFRGAVSGLGLLDVWVASSEVGRFVKGLLASGEDRGSE